MAFAELGDAPPEWGGLAVALAARGLEEHGVSRLISDGWRGLGQREPLLGVAWDCEYFIDVGARGYRGTRGGVEGFVLKAAVLERCWRGDRIRERILYPLIGGGGYSFLPVVGGERQRQASLYLAELGIMLAIALGEQPPGGGEGRRLVVRHGALLQQFGTYFNQVFDMPCRRMEAVLRYTGLPLEEVYSIRDAAVATRRDRGEACNPGAAALAILSRLSRVDATIAAVSEDLSRSRHLAVHTLLGVLAAYSRSIHVDTLVKRAISGAPCLGDLLDDPGTAAHDMSKIMEGILASLFSSSQDRNPWEVLEEASRASLDEQVLAVYRGQALERMGVKSDVDVLMLYRYLYGPEDLTATPPLSKSMLVEPLAIASYNTNKMEDALGAPAARIRELLSRVDFTYIFTDRIPSCTTLAGYAERMGVTPREVADLVQVRHPVRLEYIPDKHTVDLARHVYTQSQATHFGVPAPLIVVDQRSRVNEWEAAALASLLENLGRRIVPYSTFIRDFATRRHYMT